jgi:hypothetical protein
MWFTPAASTSQDIKTKEPKGHITFMPPAATALHWRPIQAAGSGLDEADDDSFVIRGAKYCERFRGAALSVQSIASGAAAHSEAADRVVRATRREETRW